MIVPVSLGVLTFLTFGVDVPGWIVVLGALVVPVGLATAAWYVHRNLPPFEAAFASLVPRGDVDGLQKLLDDARLLGRLAPPWVFMAKRGMLLELEGEHRAASRVLEEAYIRAPKSRRADLLGPLARNKYALGEFDALREIAVQWRARALFPGAPSLYLAAAYLADPREDVADARSLLEEVRVGLSPDERALREALMEKVAAREQA